METDAQKVGESCTSPLGLTSLLRHFTPLLHFVFCSYYTTLMVRIWATNKMEEQLQAEGFGAVAGVDEVGRGSIAGPVTLGLVILPEDFKEPVTDSKLLSRAQRAEKAEQIKAAALVCEVAHVEPEVIDNQGIVAALVEAGRRIWNDLPPERCPQVILLDGSHNFLKLDADVRTVVRGDQLSRSIAAASIVAKHLRDELMYEQADLYPEYGWEMNVGYGTPKHIAALKSFGPTPLHRRSFITRII